MCMTVNHQRNRISIDRLFEPARPDEWKDFGRFTVRSVLHRRVVQQSDQMLGSQTGQGRLELQRLVDGSMDELFNNRLAPWAERALAESAAKPLYARDTNPADFHGVAVENHHTGVNENLPHFVLFPGFEIVV